MANNCRMVIEIAPAQSGGIRELRENGGAEVLETKPKPEGHRHILHNAHVELPESLLKFDPGNGLVFVHSSYPTFRCRSCGWIDRSQVSNTSDRCQTGQIRDGV